MCGGYSGEQEKGLTLTFLDAQRAHCGECITEVGPPFFVNVISVLIQGHLGTLWCS